MSSPEVTPQKPSPEGDLISNRPLTEPTQDCPQDKCGIMVYVGIDKNSTPPLNGVGTTVTKADVKQLSGPGSKPTDTAGMAEYLGLEPGAYKVTVTLTADQLKDYAWPCNDDTSTDDTKSVPANLVKAFPFIVEPLARPKIKLVWKTTPDVLGRPQEESDPKDGDVVPGVHVKLKDLAYPDTNGDGIAELPASSKGLRAGSYPVQLTFDKEHIQLLDERSIDVPKGSTATEIFHICPCWVEFVISDQFQRAFEGEVDFVLTYPESKKTETGTLTTDLKGKLRRPVPPGEYKFALKLLYSSQWGGSRALVGKTIGVQVQATGHEVGDIRFDFFDGCASTDNPLDTVTASKLSGETAEAEWMPDAQKLSAITSGTVRFIAKAGKSKAVSGPIPILGERVFKVTGTDGNPFQTGLVLYFSDGDRIPAQSVAGEAKPLVPLGKQLVGIELSGQSERIATFKIPGAAGELSSFFPKVG
jgi:hypothetical protein